MTLDAGAKAALVGGTAAAAAGALSASDILLLVALPLLAAFVGLAGMGVLEGRSNGAILREFVGLSMLGGVAAIVALAAIEWLGVRGYGAALLTLIVGMGILSIARALRKAGPRLLDPLLAGLGLRRVGKDDGDGN